MFGTEQQQQSETEKQMLFLSTLLLHCGGQRALLKNGESFAAISGCCW